MKKIIRASNALINFPIDVWHLFINDLPGPIGFKLRYIFWKKRLKFLGKSVKIEIGVYFQNPQFISIGDNCWIDRGVMILGGADKSRRARRLVLNNNFTLDKGMVHIGSNVHIAPYSIISGIGGVFISDDCTLSSGVKVYSLSHHYRSDEAPSNRMFRFGSCDVPERQFIIEGPIFIGENVGVALNSVILPGVSIGKCSFVAVNSVVGSSFEENSLIKGDPARRVSDRFESVSN